MSFLEKSMTHILSVFVIFGLMVPATKAIANPKWAPEVTCNNRDLVIDFAESWGQRGPYVGHQLVVNDQRVAQWFLDRVPLLRKFETNAGQLTIPVEVSYPSPDPSNRPETLTTYNWPSYEANRTWGYLAAIWIRWPIEHIVMRVTSTNGGMMVDFFLNFRNLGGAPSFIVYRDSIPLADWFFKRCTRPR